MWEQTKSKDMELLVLTCFGCIPVASEPMVHLFLWVCCVKSFNNLLYILSSIPSPL